MEARFFYLVLVVGAVYCASMPLMQELQLSSPKRAVSAVEADNKLFLVGGFEYHGTAAASKIDVFDVATKSWNKSIDLLSPRGFISPVVIDPHIYCIGGYDLVNSPYIYSPTKRDLIPLAPGPTVRSNPKSVSIYNSILTVVGDFSVDFFDLQNNQSKFYPELTSFMSQLYQSDSFSYKDLVFVIGGHNITTNEIIYDTAWIFNTTSRNFVEYSNITSKDQPAVFQVSVSENVLVVRYEAISVLLMYHLVQDRWHEERDVQYPLEPVTVNDVTHMFGGSYKSYNWVTGATQVSSDNIYIGFTFLGDIIYVTKAVPPGLVIVSNGVINTYPNRGVQLYNDAIFSAPWNSRQYIFSDGAYIHVFDAVNKDITTISGFNRVSSIFIMDATTFVMFDTDIISSRILASTMKTYNSNLVMTNSVSLTVPMAPQEIIGDDFIDYVTGKSAKVSDIQNVANLSVSFVPLSQATARSGDVFAIMLTDPNALKDVTTPKFQHYHKIDVYNYKTNTWEDSIDLPQEFTAEPLKNFVVAAAVNDKILTWYKSGFGYYDLTAKKWTIYTDNVTYSSALYYSKFNVELEVFMTTPVFNNLAFIPNPTLDRYLVVNYTTMDQPSSTAAFVSDGLPHSIRQRVPFGDFIYAAFFSSSDGGYDGLSYYKPATDNWQIFRFGAIDFLNIASYGTDGILLFDGNQTMSVYYATTGTIDPYNVDFAFRPAVSMQAGQLTVIAGGQHIAYDVYTDRVLIFEAPLIEVPTPPVNATPEASVSAPSGLSDGDFIAAIVVPIVGTLLIVGLIVFLVLFLKRRKRRGSSTTIGLEQRFGEWFTPFSDIRFEEQLGQGANGQVFKGKWKGTTVALKVSMTQAEQSVISELSLLIGLRPHPNVVQLFGFSVHPETNNVILILEFCDGGSLDVMLYDGSTTFDNDQKLNWMRGIARGIAHLHSNNVVHRDLAARNVLIHQGEPKITDFGMSRVVDEEQQRGTTKSDIGPIRWMAPESLKHKQYSTKSDVWTFGILMYEIILQREPHFDASDAITIGRLIRDEGLTPRVPPSMCPPEWLEVMKQCWALKPDQRPSMETVLQQLESIKIKGLE